MARALDLFCGGGGVSLGLKALGFSVVGVDNDRNSLGTSWATGTQTLCRDLAERAYVSGPFDFLWASPPCTAFSNAGPRHAREHLGDLRRAIQHEDWDWGRREGIDPSVWLILSAMESIVRILPNDLAMENVPPTEPVFQYCLQVLERYGYVGEVGELSSEQFGVPQTRSRCFLIASRVRGARLPEPTHARYVNPQHGRKLAAAKEMDAGLKPYVPVGAVIQNGMRGLSGNGIKRIAIRSMDEPAPTIVFGNGLSTWRWHAEVGGRGMLPEEATALQGFPPDHPWQGSKRSVFRQIANAVPPPVAIAVAGAATGVVWQVILEQYLAELLSAHGTRRVDR